MIFYKILFRIFRIFKAVSHYLAFFFRSKRALPDSPENIFYDPSHSYSRGRYTFLLLKLLSISGYKVFLRNSIQNFFRFVEDDEWIFQEEGIYFLRSFPKKELKNSLFLFHGIPNEAKIKNFRWNIKIDQDYFSNILFQKKTAAFLPYTMHPCMYRQGYFRFANSFRNNEKLCKIFFSGGFYSKEYSNPLIKDLFNKTTRSSIVQRLFRSIPKERLQFLESKEEVRKFFLESGKKSLPTLNRIIFLKPPVNDQLVENKDWLRILSHANFFLALSGITMPVCHNIIEAMSVGTIPITEYPELFSPPLIDGENCIQFTGEEDFLKQVERAFSLPEKELKRMKNLVSAYYDEHLDPNSIKEKLHVKKENSLISTIYYNTEHRSVELFLKNSKRR